MANARLTALCQTPGWRLEDNIAHGIRSGYAFNISAPSNFVITMFLPESFEAGPLVGGMKKARKQLGIVNLATGKKGVLTITLRAVRGNAQAAAAALLQRVDGIAGYLYNAGVPHDCCALCGKGEATGAVLLRGNLVRAHTECVEQKLAQQQEKEIDQGPSHRYLLGFIGALLGAAVGAIPWVVVSVMGFVSAYLAVLIAICAHFGYKLFTGKRYGPFTRPLVLLASLVGLALCVVLEFGFYYVMEMGAAPASVAEFGSYLEFYIADVLMQCMYTAIFGLLGIVLSWKMVPKNQEMAREYREYSM